MSVCPQNDGFAWLRLQHFPSSPLTRTPIIYYAPT